MVLNQNGNKLVWGMTGTGAIIGKISSENETQGTLIGGLLGFVSGTILKTITTNIREKGKRIKAVNMVNEINRKILELNNLDKKIISLKEKIRDIPRLSHKKILIPISDGSNPQSNSLVPEFPVRDLKPTARLQKDVSDVYLTGTNSEKIINSHDLKKMDFKVLDFRGRWNDFFGFPSVNFHCIIHGMPGEGKSTFAIQFAKYLAENIGRVVYISGEEGFTKTLRDKFMNNDGVSKYLDIADLRTFDDVIKNIPAEVYNFIFIDSLDNMRIDAEKMKKIRERYKNSSLITISQSTKDGKIRGSNELVHDSYIAVKVENGIALTIKNRFKAKGMQLEVFS
jgi:DNA polymerase III delta prime subunit